MRSRPLAIPGVWLFEPAQHRDERGLLLEWYKADVVAAATGRAMPLAQANNSVSAAGVVRGIHFASVPPGQAKYVYCPRGAVLDVVVDIRVGSPTFGSWASARLDDVDRHALYVAEGLGHGFAALTADASLAYLCSAPYDPAREHALQPLDADLGIDWQVEAPAVSPRDAGAVSLAEAEKAGILPSWEDCLHWYERSGQAVRR